MACSAPVGLRASDGLVIADDPIIAARILMNRRSFWMSRDRGVCVRRVFPVAFVLALAFVSLVRVADPAAQAEAVTDPLGRDLGDLADARPWNRARRQVEAGPMRRRRRPRRHQHRRRPPTSFPAGAFRFLRTCRQSITRRCG